MKIPIKNFDEIRLMSAAGAITAQILDEVEEIIKPGVSTEVINDFVHRRTLEFGAIPAPLNYKGYPKSVCTSVNEVVCHGIPSPYQVLKAGDIINVDVTSIKDGYHGDSSRMYFVGGRSAASKEIQDLVDITREALFIGINEVAPGKHVGDIGAAIQNFIENQDKKYGIVRDYTGHGIGKKFHESPQVLHIGTFGTGPKLAAGMCFTIEPMINLGTYKTVLSQLDGWTVRTADNKYSAQWEHTVLVTNTGYQILTLTK